MKQPKLLDRVRDAIRARHYSYRTEQAYVHWIKRYVHFHEIQHPATLGAPEVSAFLSHLATERHVAAATQNKALSALLFLYRNVLGVDLPWMDDVVRARRPERLPTVLSTQEVARLLASLRGDQWLMASLIYGGGLRLRECLRLRVKDIDFDCQQVLVRDGKGHKDRSTILPDTLVEPVQRQLERARILLQRDLSAQFQGVSLPFALARKYPSAPYELAWQYVFPSRTLVRDPRTAKHLRHHVHAASLQRAIKRALRDAGIRKPASTLRFGIHLRRTCWSETTISARCKSCWDTKTCAPP